MTKNIAGNMTQWIRLHLRSCGPRFDPQAQHLPVFNLGIFELWWEKDKNKQKEAGIGPFKNAGNITKNGGNLGPEGMKGNLS